MKFQSLVLSSVVSFLMSASALAAPVPGAPIVSQLFEFNVDQGLYTMGEAVSGQVSFNASARTVSLHVDMAIICPAGMACPAVMPNPIEVELPVTSVSETACGATKIVALQDLRPVDGNFQKVTIIDHSSDLCDNLVPALVEVIYQTRGWNRFEATQYKTRSYFKGQAFQQQ